MAAVSFLAANTSTTAEVNRLWIQTPANTSRIQGKEPLESFVDSKGNTA